ncbi:MAG TPA: hypothetical protein VKU38_07910 [Ktedonobacteraceae bacterium]|nr:hypothetical protein [Ktedonobacteraceae bacterium]
MVVPPSTVHAVAVGWPVCRHRLGLAHRCGSCPGCAKADPYALRRMGRTTPRARGNPCVAARRGLLEHAQRDERSNVEFP